MEAGLIFKSNPVYVYILKRIVKFHFYCLEVIRLIIVCLSLNIYINYQLNSHSVWEYIKYTNTCIQMILHS